MSAIMARWLAFASVMMLCAAMASAADPAPPKPPDDPPAISASATTQSPRVAQNVASTAAQSTNPVAPLAGGANVMHEGRLVHMVHLQNDGNLVGRVGVFDAAGVRRPVLARIAFAKEGQLLQTVRSDEWGRFQVTGLKPGVYSALIVGQGVFGAFQVKVAQFKETALTEELFLDATLVPVADAPVFGQLIASETNMMSEFFPGIAPTAALGAGAPVAATAAAGAAAGGGMGLGGMLGALGALGFGGGGSGVGGGGGTPASNTTPTTTNQ